MSEERREESRGETKRIEISEDVEELRGVLSAISDFLTAIKEPIKDIIDTLSGSLDGKKLGEEVGRFYSSLVESGVPEEMAKEMTREFFKKRLESAPTISNLMNMLTSAVKGGKLPMVAVKEENVKEVIDRIVEELDKAAERASPEAKPFIDAIKKSLREKFKEG